MSKRLGVWLNRVFPKKKKPEEWTETPPATEQAANPTQTEWKSVEDHRVPGHPAVKRALATILALIYAATIFTVPMDTFSAGLTLCTVYIMLDYMMITRR